MTVHAAIYARQSVDVAEGIERQITRCTSLVDARGWVLGTTYEDNDTSASKARGEGTAWARMLADRPAVVVAVNLDRLLRTQRDLVTLIDAGIKVVTLEGELDLASASGEMQASVLTAMARFEARRKGERQQRANEQRARAGHPDWRTRPLGFELDGAQRPSEATAIRKGAQMLLEGASLAAVGRMWAAAGVMPPRASSWSLPALRKVFLAPRLAGLRTYQGAVIGKASWAPILDEPTWTAVCDLLRNPSRRTNPGDSNVRHLLSGILICPKCGKQMLSNWQKDKHGVNRRSYRCQPTGHVQRLAEPLDGAAARAAALVLAMPTARAVFTEHDGIDADGLRAERASVSARRSEWLTSGMAPADVRTALEPLDARLAAIDAALLDDTRADTFADLWGDMAFGPNTPEAGVARFAGLPLHRQRGVLRALFDALTPGPDGLDVTPSASTQAAIDAVLGREG